MSYIHRILTSSHNVGRIFLGNKCLLENKYKCLLQQCMYLFFIVSIITTYLASLSHKQLVSRMFAPFKIIKEYNHNSPC